MELLKMYIAIIVGFIIFFSIPLGLFFILGCSVTAFLIMIIFSFFYVPFAVLYPFNSFIEWFF